MEQVLLSIGHGYSAGAIARALGPDWRIFATTRSPERAADFARAGLEPVVWTPGGDDAALRAALAEATHLATSVPPARGPDGSDPVVAHLHGLSAPHLRWIGYVSASSVYGDAGGEWVDETTATAPGTDRGAARLRAETDWQALATACAVPIAFLRVAGIYGPGRSALDALREGRAHRLIKPGQVFNRIHVTDLGRIAAAAAAAQASGPFNLCDDLPSPPQDVVTHAAALLGQEPPPEQPFDPDALGPMARSFYSENKRLRSVRVGPELGIRLLYPDYRAGLAAIHAGTP
ncbi:MAG: NAD dependent epimerase/dehydratase family [Rhodobacteraceae bacterium HLUCCA12]|nr:MAG: NAD dependent epimerase/dehydratase family [Rhodobacteraceae bacterium HLUCCA12]